MDGEILPPEAPAKAWADQSSLREQMLDAMGVDPSGMANARPTVLGGRVDMEIVGRWANDLGLSNATVLAVINETMATKRDGPPSTFRYFTPAMEREAARAAEAPLKPANTNEAYASRRRCD